MAGSSGYKLDQPTVDAIIELISTYISTGQLPGGGGSTTLVGSLTSTSTTSALRADQGPAITALISTAQSTANSASTAAANAQSTANTAQSTANGKYTKPGSGIPQGDLEKYPTIALVGSKLLSDSDSGSIFTVVGSVAVTIPTGLANTFTATFIIQTGGSVNVIPTSPVTLNGGTATLSRSTTTDTRVDLVSLVSTNTYVLTGGLALGGGGTNATNLTTSTSATTLTVNSDTGTDAVLPAATTSVAGVLTAADKTKLDGVAVNATANTSDAVLLNRANHTGTQSASTITGLGTAALAATGDFATAIQGTRANAATFSVASIAALRAVTVATTPSSTVEVLGYYTPGDGGGGVYYQDAADTATGDNGGTVIVGSDGRRWKLFDAGTISVRQFGAKMDGNYGTGAGTDNTAAFQAAINSLSQSGGGVLHIPGGTPGRTAASACYKLVSQITIPDGVSVYGDGMWSSMLFCPNAFANTQGLVKVSGSNGYPTCIRDIGIVAQTGGAGGVGLRVNKNGVTLRGIWVNGFTSSAGIYLENTDIFLSEFASEMNAVGVITTSNHVNISNGTVYGNQIGVVVQNGSSVEPGPTVITGVRAPQCLLKGFDLSSAKYVQLIGCSAGHVNTGQLTTAGISASSANNIVIDGFQGTIQSGPSSAGVGILLTDSSDVTINGCTLTGWYDGIRGSGGSQRRVVVSGNTVKSCGRHGIYMSGGDNVTITGNQSFGNGLSGVSSAGILAEVSQTFSLYNVNGNICSQDGGGQQDYGLIVDVTTQANAGWAVSANNVCKFNANTNYAASGQVANISSTGNLS